MQWFEPSLDKIGPIQVQHDAAGETAGFPLAFAAFSDVRQAFRLFSRFHCISPRWGNADKRTGLLIPLWTRDKGTGDCPSLLRLSSSRGAGIHRFSVAAIRSLHYILLQAGEIRLFLEHTIGSDSRLPTD